MMINPTETLFTAALGLTPPWICTGMDFAEKEFRLDIIIDFPHGSRVPCPDCNGGGLTIHDTVEKEWRHLDETTIGRFVQDLHGHNGDPDSIHDICMDMSPAFIEAALE